MLFEIPLLLLFITLFILLRKNGDSQRLPPGPKRLPIIGNLHQLGNMSHRSLRDLSRKFGDLMYLQLGSVPALVISSPNRAQDIFKNYDTIFSGRPPLYQFRKVSYQHSSVATAPYGKYWREMRKIMVLELMTARRVQSFAHIRVQEVAHMIEHIKSMWPNPIDLGSSVFSLSNNVVSRVAFGETNPVGVNGIGFQKLFQDLQSVSGQVNIDNFFPSLAWVNRLNGVDKKLDRNHRLLDMFFDNIIEKHKREMEKSIEHEDLIHVLLRIQKDQNRTIQLTDERIKAMLVDVFVAGTDTSAVTIEWTMTELMRNPKVKEKVVQEVKQVGKGKTKIEEGDLPKLIYLKQVIKESFRLHPPVPLSVPRETTKKCIIDNKYEIPANTRVFFNTLAISTDDRYWKDAEEFLPERFMDTQIDFKGQHFELLPFGAGRRICPGMNFAIPVVELALANLLFCFDWELPNGITKEEIDMEEVFGITSHRKNLLYLVAKPTNWDVEM